MDSNQENELKGTGVTRPRVVIGAGKGSISDLWKRRVHG